MSTAVHISLEEFIARPDREDDQREEFIEGEVIVSPAAKAWHADIVRLLRDQLLALKELGFVLVNGLCLHLGQAFDACTWTWPRCNWGVGTKRSRTTAG